MLSIEYAVMEKVRNSAGVVLVTGATGFVGGNLVRTLVEKGHSVACLVRSRSRAAELGRLPVRLVVADLDDLSGVRGALRNIHTVYHIAGAIKAATREQYFRANQAGTRRLLEFLAETNPELRRFVHVSSLAAAGPSPSGRGLTEEEEPKPISWYGESKLASEQEVLRFKDVFPVAIVRPSAVYGPGDRETLSIFRMIKSGFFCTPGRFTRRFSLIHVDDLNAGLLRAGERDVSSGEIFFVSRPEIHTWDDIGQAIAHALGTTYHRIAIPGPLAALAGRAGDALMRVSGRPLTLSSQKMRDLLQPSWVCDCSKAYSRLEFAPHIDLKSGMRDTVGWYREHGWL